MTTGGFVMPHNSNSKVSLNPAGELKSTSRMSAGLMSDGSVMTRTGAGQTVHSSNTCYRHRAERAAESKRSHASGPATINTRDKEPIFQENQKNRAVAAQFDTVDSRKAKTGAR